MHSFNKLSLYNFNVDFETQYIVFVYTLSVTRHTIQSGSVAARAAFLGGALNKSGARAGGTASLPRNLDSSNFGSSSLEENVSVLMFRVFAFCIVRFVLQETG